MRHRAVSEGYERVMRVTRRLNAEDTEGSSAQVSMLWIFWSAAGSNRRPPPCSCQVPLRSVAAYFFQGRTIRKGASIRTGAGRVRIM